MSERWYKYQEYRGEWAKELDPITAPNPIWEGQKAYRLVNELLKYIRPMIQRAASDQQADRLLTCIGCDCAYITQALHEVAKRDGQFTIDGQRKCGGLKDVAILIRGCETKLLPLHQAGYEIHPEDLSKLEFAVTYEMDEEYDHLIVCRQFEANSGHGMRWLRISKAQGLELFNEWNQWQDEVVHG